MQFYFQHALIQKQATKSTFRQSIFTFYSRFVLDGWKEEEGGEEEALPNVLANGEKIHAARPTTLSKRQLQKRFELWIDVATRDESRRLTDQGSEDAEVRKCGRALPRNMSVDPILSRSCFPVLQLSRRKNLRERSPRDPRKSSLLSARRL